MLGCVTELLVTDLRLHKHLFLQHRNVTAQSGASGRCCAYGYGNYGDLKLMTL